MHGASEQDLWRYLDGRERLAATILCLAELEGRVRRAASEIVAHLDSRGWRIVGVDNNMRADFFGPNIGRPEVEAECPVANVGEVLSDLVADIDPIGITVEGNPRGALQTGVTRAFECD